MFRWYMESTICYALLSDVSAGVLSIGEEVKPRWFTRGWTLQELGTKLSLCPILTQLTGVPERLLQEGDLEQWTVAEKMSWASRRRTTRVEDEAYCRMGLFNVNMPLLYGEGQNAFLRLQEQILRTMED